MLKAAQNREKNYADPRRNVLEFEVGDMIFFKVALWNGMIRFQKRGKLNPQYIKPFQTLKELNL